MSLALVVSQSIGIIAANALDPSLDPSKFSAWGGHSTSDSDATKADTDTVKVGYDATKLGFGTISSQSDPSRRVRQSAQSAAPVPNPDIDLDQCRNGGPTTPNDCLALLGGSQGWVNGNANATQAHFVEGMSIPYRAVMSGVPTGLSITLVLGYDIRHSGKNALDYLTHFDRLEPHTPFGHPAETVTPTSGVSGISSTTDTFPIPAPSSAGSPVAGQPTASFNALPAGERVMTLFGGDITNVAYVSQGSLTENQSETQIAVTFSLDSSDAVLSWGGHIASRLDWGFDSKGEANSAGGISGSPYHMRLIDWECADPQDPDCPDGGLPNLGNTDRALAAAAVIAAPTLTITKSASSLSVAPGTSFSYTITVKNTGNAQATGLTITDDLADSLTGVSASFDVDPGTAGGTGPCTVGAGNTISCAVGTLAANDNAANGPDEVVVTINATAPNSCGDLTNTAQVDWTENAGDPVASNQVTVTVTGCAPTLTITKAASSQSVGVGTAFSYTITVKNTGNAQATGVTITDDLADSLTGVSASFDVDPGTAGGTGPCTVGSGNTISCAVGTLAANNGAANGPDEVVVTINATAPTGSCPTLTNTATVDSDQTSPQTSNQVTVTVTGCAPGLEITKGASSTQVTFGSAFSYTITVTNTGNAQATGVTITDDLADSLTGVSASFDKDPGSGTDGTCTVGASTNTIGCAVGTLAANDNAANGPDEVLVTINATAPRDSCPTLTNTATVDSDQTSPQTSNQVTVTVTGCAPGLEITKGASSTQVTFGSAFSYTITVTNTGNAQATGVTITDDLADSLTNVSATFDVDPGTSGGTGNCDIGAGNTVTCPGSGQGSITLAASDGNTTGAEPDVVKVTINATAPNTCGELTNTATVDSDQTSPQTSNQVTVTVTGCAPGLEITKAASSTQVPFGSSFSYIITVTNTGNAQATGVVITDDLADSLTGVSASFDVDPGTAGGTGACTVGAGNTITCPSGEDTITLAANNNAANGPDEVVVTINATAPNTCGPLTNTAHVRWEQNTEGISSSQVTVNVVGCVPPPPPPPSPIGINIDKSGPALAHVGDTVTYAFAVTLTTSTPLSNLTVTDPICSTAPTLVSKTGGDQDTTLEPGETWNFSCTHVVTASDPDPLPNTATVTGTAPDGRNTSDTDNHVVDIIHPAIRIVKTADPTSVGPGETVTYTFRVTNTGDVTLFNVEVTDNKLGDICTIPQLDVGETETCTATFRVPDRAGPVDNVGVAEGQDVTGVTVRDDDNASVDIVLGQMVTPTRTPPGGVAFTGAGGVITLAGLALLLLLAGSGILFVTRHRDDGSEA